MVIAYIDEDGTWKTRTALFHNNSPPDAYDKWFVVLIDTGAEKTVLSVPAAVGLGVDFNALPKSDKKIFGVAGHMMETWKLDKAGFLFLNADGNYHLETCEDLLVADTWGEDYFGIIGRDLLNRFNIISDIETKKIYLNRIESINPELFKTIKVM
jgi:hypothetical protein